MVVIKLSVIKLVGHYGDGHKISGHNGDGHKISGHNGDGHKISGHNGDGHKISGHKRWRWRSWLSTNHGVTKVYALLHVSVNFLPRDLSKSACV